MQLADSAHRAGRPVSQRVLVRHLVPSNTRRAALRSTHGDPTRPLTRASDRADRNTIMSSSQLFKGIPVLDWIVRSTLGTQNQRMVKRYLKQVDLVNRQEERMRALTDPQLMAMTDEFRTRISKGEKPFDLRPEIFAVAREAITRCKGFKSTTLGGAL